MYEEAGYDVRGLEAGGDLLCLRKGRQTVAVECKRQERLKLPEWLAQMERDAPSGAASVLVFKQSFQPIYAVQRLEQYLEELKRC